MNLALGLINPKYPHNVGTAIRAASCYAASHLFYSGHRMDESLKELSRVPREERLRGYKEVEWVQKDYFIKFCSAQGLTPVAVEFREQAENLFDFIHPENALYVFGPEDGYIPQSALASCHRFVKIPTLHCLNLAVAITTILYDRALKKYNLTNS
jgi:tRNA(Leu) C34 or U34 (ribose-2'-O)-methylase TrmL